MRSATDSIDRVEDFAPKLNRKQVREKKTVARRCYSSAVDYRNGERLRANGDGRRMPERHRSDSCMVRPQWKEAVAILQLHGWTDG